MSVFVGITLLGRWRTTSKKGGSNTIWAKQEAWAKEEAILAKFLDSEEYEIRSVAAPASSAFERPFAFYYEFIDVCGGSGRVSSALSDLGRRVGRIIEPSDSPACNLEWIRVLEWLFHLVQSLKLKSFMMETPCPTFSSTAYAALRGYHCPKGYQPKERRTLLGTTLSAR